MRMWQPTNIWQCLKLHWSPRMRRRERRLFQWLRMWIKSFAHFSSTGWTSAGVEPFLLSPRRLPAWRFVTSLHVLKGRGLRGDSTNDKAHCHEFTLITGKPIQTAELKKLRETRRYTISKSALPHQANVLRCTRTKIIEDCAGIGPNSLISTWLHSLANQRCDKL